MNGRLVEKVCRSLNELDDQLQRYELEVKRVHLDITATLYKLAENTKTKSERNALLRKLYWELKVPTPLIKKAFGLSSIKLSRLAGKRQFTERCKSCGRRVNIICESHTQHAHFKGLAKCTTCKRSEDKIWEGHRARKIVKIESKEGKGNAP
jgi:hypothetical protein